jgi:hypothetical protein
MIMMMKSTGLIWNVFMYSEYLTKYKDSSVCLCGMCYLYYE